MSVTDNSVSAPAIHIDEPSKIRVTQSYPGAAYVLPADEEERARLIVQHQSLRRAFGGQNLLAPVVWKDGDKVLDACTGTGIWLLELAEEIPKSVELVGIDIESRLFPPAEFRPKNLELSVQSVLSLPSQWTNTFAAVHQRLLVLGLRSKEWPVALKELYRVTKPGGWAELCEFTHWGGARHCEQWWNTAVNVLARLDFVYDFGQRLESMMHNAGFEDVHMEVRNCPFGKWGGEDGIVEQNNALAVWRALMPVMMSVARDLLTSEEEFAKLMKNIEREFDESECSIQWVVCYGRKPF